MARYFVRQNSSFRFGCFTIHPMSGEISLKLNTYLGEGLFEEVINKENIQQFMMTCNITAHYVLQFHTPKILLMINLINESIFKYLDPSNLFQSKKIRFPNEECKQKLDKIKDILINKCTSIYNMKNNSKQEENEYFRYPKQNQSNGLSINIYSKLNIIEFKKNDQSFNSGGFAEVYRAKIIYISENKEYSRTIAVKQEKNDNLFDSRIRHEKKILQLLENVDCPYIAKFYYGVQFHKPDQQQYLDPKPDQQQYLDPKRYQQQYQDPKPINIFDNLLLMEFYPNKSFDHFKCNFQVTMSLNTKIYLLFQVAQGLRFLKDKEIYHLDMKPANILVILKNQLINPHFLLINNKISKNYISKITDFGESYHKNICDKNFRPGRTLPYAPPEIIQQDNQCNKFSERADVFSMGVFISDILFDEYPVEVKRGNQQILQQKYMDKSYKIKLSENYKRNNGPKHLIKLLFKLILKCMEDMNDRPYIEWIVIILRDALSYIEKMY